MPSVELRFQDPDGSTGNLLEALLTESSNASVGGAIFAWTNASGIKSFLDDPVFRKFIKSGQFDLVVGLDSITDEAAVKALAEKEAKLPGLRVHAFLHDRHEMFHPKMAWFGDGSAVTLVVGSGNLTMGGLKNNWEAFTISRLVGKDAKSALAEIARWRVAWQAFLVSITDPLVVARAKQNAGNERSLKRAPRSSTTINTSTDADLDILVAEIPRSGGRPTQANFTKVYFEGFFGANARAQSRISLYNVRNNGTLEAVESRPSVARQSQNYSFELAGMYGVPNLGGPAPVGVFLRLETGTFLYVIVQPEQ